ncbi:MAG: hypothetical protein Q9160_002812 [Pyrenula sp. 1 TL-2023]
MATNPVFVLLHGAWHTPNCFNSIVPLLEKDGFAVVCPQLPSAGADPPAPNFDADIAAIRAAVIPLLDDGRDVVVVMHSYSGIPGGTALEGLDKRSRAQNGEKGGVIRLVYIMAFLVPEGFQHSPHGTREGMVPAMVTDISAEIVTADPAGAKDMIYQDCSEEQVNNLIAELRPHSLAVFWTKTTHAAWRVIPTTYVICGKDSPSTVVAANWLIDAAKSSGTHAIDRVVRRDVGHSPFISQSE